MMKSHAYENQGVAVFGLGKSGLATARRLAEGQARVFVWDDGEQSRETAKSYGLTVQNFEGEGWADTGTVVLSPGIPLTHPKPHPVVDYATAQNMSVVGDIEIFLNEKTAGRIVGITGTNGKSTTSALIYHILKTSGAETALGGNIGTPVMDLPALSDEGVYVLELSSYQLDLTPSWHADVAILLNITPDHLDRHGDMEGYAAVKKRIFQNQLARDAAIINMDDPLCRKIADEVSGHGHSLSISTERRLESGVSVLGGMLQVFAAGRFQWDVDLRSQPALKGAHNWQNAAAAAACCLALGLKPKAISKGLMSFGGLAHRMEPVGAKDNVAYVNDSKATNAEAAAKSLGSFENIYWICGGVSKAGGIDSLSGYFDRLAHVFLIGACSDEFATALEGRVPFSRCETLDNAVQMASNMARDAGQEATVLLAPAAASFDQFKSFEARGDAYRALVQAEVAK